MKRSLTKYYSVFLLPLILIFSINLETSAADSLKLKFENAVALLSQEDFIEAEKVFLEYLEFHETSELYYNLGVAYNGQANFIMALWAFENALKIKPNNELIAQTAFETAKNIENFPSWESPYSSWIKFAVLVPIPLWYILSFFSLCLVGFLLYKIISSKLVQKTYLYLALSLACGSLFISLGFTAHQHYNEDSFILFTTEDIPTYLSVDGMAFNADYIPGMRYPILSQNEKWIKFEFSDDRPLWVEKSKVLMY